MRVYTSRVLVIRQSILKTKTGCLERISRIICRLVRELGGWLMSHLFLYPSCVWEEL